MILRFGNRVTTLIDLYHGYDDIPSLAVHVHLHAWGFDQPEGVATLRLELREEWADAALAPPEGASRLIGAALAKVTPHAVLEARGSAPLIQAVMDALLGHESVRAFLTRAAKESLHLPDGNEEENLRIPLRQLKAAKLKDRRKP